MEMCWFNSRENTILFLLCYEMYKRPRRLFLGTDTPLQMHQIRLYSWISAHLFLHIFFLYYDFKILLSHKRHISSMSIANYYLFIRHVYRPTSFSIFSQSLARLTRRIYFGIIDSEILFVLIVRLYMGKGEEFIYLVNRRDIRKYSCMSCTGNGNLFTSHRDSTTIL